MSYVRPPRQRPFVVAARENRDLATVVNSVNDNVSRFKWHALVSHVLDGLTPEDVRCALSLEAAEAAALLERCKRSASFEQLTMQDVLPLHSLANWVREMNFDRVNELYPALRALESAMSRLKTAMMNVQLSAVDGTAIHDRLSSLITEARQLHTPSEPGDTCMPSYQPADGAELATLPMYMCQVTLRAELAQAYNTKHAALVMRAASAELINDRLRPYLDDLDRLNAGGVEAKDVLKGLRKVEVLLGVFNVQNVVRMKNDSVR